MTASTVDVAVISGLLLGHFLVLQCWPQYQAMVVKCLNSALNCKPPIAPDPSKCAWLQMCHTVSERGTEGEEEEVIWRSHGLISRLEVQVGVQSFEVWNKFCSRPFSICNGTKWFCHEKSGVSFPKQPHCQAPGSHFQIHWAECHSQTWHFPSRHRLQLVRSHRFLH